MNYYRLFNTKRPLHYLYRNGADFLNGLAAAGAPRDTPRELNFDRSSVNPRPSQPHKLPEAFVLIRNSVSLAQTWPGGVHDRDFASGDGESAVAAVAILVSRNPSSPGRSSGSSASPSP